MSDLEKKLTDREIDVLVPKIPSTYPFGNLWDELIYLQGKERSPTEADVRQIIWFVLACVPRSWFRLVPEDDGTFLPANRLTPAEIERLVSAFPNGWPFGKIGEELLYITKKAREDYWLPGEFDAKEMFQTCLEYLPRSWFNPEAIDNPVWESGLGIGKSGGPSFIITRITEESGATGHWITFTFPDPKKTKVEPSEKTFQVWKTNWRSI